MASPGKKAYPLRIDPALWEELQRLAARDLRSVNAQIEFLLREGLARRGIKHPEAKKHDDDTGSDGASESVSAIGLESPQAPMDSRTMSGACETRKRFVMSFMVPPSMFRARDVGVRRSGRTSPILCA